MPLLRTSTLLVLILAHTPQVLGQFVEHIISTDLNGGYQVIAADLNRDHRPDLVAVSTSLSELVWYENPQWERHVIAGNLIRMINVAACDIDGDGIPELALAHGFESNAGQSSGIVSIFHHNGDPRRPWAGKEIDRLPTSHRLRWADIEGNGHRVLINAPLTGINATAPEYRDSVPLVFYRPGNWDRILISNKTQGILHGLLVYDWNGNGHDDLLIGSFQGIHLHSLEPDGNWTRTELTKGDPAQCPACGTSDLAVGHLGNKRFLAAIEPWHGNQVVVYYDRNGEWTRNVIDSSMVDGHTILTHDFFGNGRDAIIAGMRGDGYRVSIYRCVEPGNRVWERQELDSRGMAAACCVASDLNGDGKVDVACIGSATHNLKWYENVSKTGRGIKRPGKSKP